MSHILFQWGEDQQRGEHGWIPAAYPHFNAILPGGFGHDCIEHFPRGLKHGPIADELLALGARLWMRVDSGWWWTEGFWNHPNVAWGSEVSNLLRDMRYEDLAAPKVITVGETGTDMDEEIEQALGHGVKSANDEVLSELDPDDFELGEDEPGYKVESELIQSMGAWLRLGVIAAQKRFQHASAFDVVRLQEKLDQAAEPFRYAEEGDRLLVRINEVRMEFSLHYSRPGSSFGEGSRLITGNL